MLEDHTFSHVVSWGPNGDYFVVKVRPSPMITFLLTHLCSGHEQVHKLHPSLHIQALQLCLFRQAAEQVQFPLGASR